MDIYVRNDLFLQDRGVDSVSLKKDPTGPRHILEPQDQEIS